MSPLPSHSDSGSPLLSADGQQRRDAIRAACTAQLPAIRAGVRRQRWLVRSGAAAGLLAGLVAVQVWFAGGPARIAATPVERPRQPAAIAVHPAPSSAVAAPPAEPPRPQPTVKIESIDDDQLVELLQSAGRPSSVGRIGGKLVVVPQTVALRRRGALTP